MKYIAKPVIPMIIEAIKWDGTVNTIEQIKKEFPDIFIEHAVLGVKDSPIYIEVLKEKRRFVRGEYIVKGLNGDYYPCKAHIFEQKYQKRGLKW